MTIEDKYLEKINNDIDESLYDLLSHHIKESHQKIKTKKEEFIKLLEKAIKKLKKNISPYNQLEYFRYIILCCNTILRFDKNYEKVKEIKKEIIKEYTHSDSIIEGKIPLNYQINEIRITYNSEYLVYLIDRYISKKKYREALYCLIAVKLIEPDNEKIDKWEKEIKENIKDKVIEKRSYKDPKNYLLALDSNVVISRIFYDVDDYRIPHEETFNLELLGNNNKFIITSSVQKEVKEHLEFQLIQVKNFCNKNKKFDYDEIYKTLSKRYEKIMDKYLVETGEVDIKDIKYFYSNYIENLEEILYMKLSGSSISKKLRKIAQRENLLPEIGDMQLLKEVIELSKTNEKIGILSMDKDFTYFTKEIEDRFNIKIFEKD